MKVIFKRSCLHWSFTFVYIWDRGKCFFFLQKKIHRLFFRQKNSPCGIGILSLWPTSLVTLISLQPPETDFLFLHTSCADFTGWVFLEISERKLPRYYLSLQWIIKPYSLWSQPRLKKEALFKMLTYYTKNKRHLAIFCYRIYWKILSYRAAKLNNVFKGAVNIIGLTQ